MGIDYNALKKKAKSEANKGTELIEKQFTNNVIKPLTGSLSVSKLTTPVNKMLKSINEAFEPIKPVKEHSQTIIKTVIAGLKFMVDGLPYYMQTGYRGVSTGVGYTETFIINQFDFINMSIKTASIIFAVFGSLFSFGVFTLLV